MRKLPEIKVELTFRNELLQWRPSFEETRAKLYGGISRFLAIPLNFRGVGDSADGQFNVLLQKSAYLYGGIYKDAEVLLNAIEAVRQKWLSLTNPLQDDDFEWSKEKTPQEWEEAFKSAKQWAQKVTIIIFFIKILNKSSKN